ncbi:MAG: GNAT family protein [Patescibacteria group bacterium]|nr:GNAT family protein [Patescibacteria group bacterium]
MQQPTIKTKHFILRPFKMSDAESVAENVNNKNIYRHMLVIPYPYTIKDAKQWLRKVINNNRKKIPENAVFAIEIDGQAVGSISINKIEQEHKAEIGYWLGEKYQGKGIMTQAIKEITKYGFRELKLCRLYAQVFSFNEGSMRVLEKNGYKFEGTLKKEVKKDNKFLDCCLFAKTRSKKIL